jgi:hypothetical protein
MIQNVFFSSLLVHLCLAMTAMAAPVADKSLSATALDNAWQYGTGGGILGLIVLVLDVLVFSKSCFGFKCSFQSTCVVKT